MVSHMPDREHVAAAALTGAAALGYELLWTRLLGLAFGHEQLGVLSVLAGFFAGLALGGALAHGRADSLRRPGRVFALLQLIAAAHALASPWLLGRIGGWLSTQLGPNPSPLWSLLAATLLLLPATCAIGASLPLLIAARRRIAGDDARGVARIYAYDTFGATIGVLATVHLLLPRLGVVGTAVVASALGLAAAGFGLRLPTHSSTRERPRTSSIGRDDPDDGLLRERWILYVIVGATGLLGLGLQVVGVRVLSQVFSATIYSFADLLAVWLLGTALGSGAYARVSARALGHRPATVLIALLLALALTIAISAGAAANAGALLEWLGPADASWTRRQLAELATVAAVLGPATLLMGACLAHLFALIAAPSPDGDDEGEREAGERSIGGALAINALAAAAAPFVFGLWALSELGYAQSWAAIAWGYLLLALALAWLRRFPPRQIALASILGGLGVLAASAGAPSLVLVDDEDPGWTLIERREGPLGVVAVSSTTQAPGSPERPLVRLRVDRHFRMGGAMSIGERRMGHLSLLWANAGEGDSVVFLGVGTGATAGAGVAYPIERLTAVELIPEVIDMLPHFQGTNANLVDDPRTRIIAADARRFVHADRDRHALIVADLFHPARAGAGSLYAREHFEAARDHLVPHGLFVQWLPLYQLDDFTLRVIVSTFLDVFPEAHAMLALYNVETPALGLVGSVDPPSIDLARLEATLADPARAELHGELALLDPRDFLAGYMLDREGLVELAGDAPINDDLHPRIDVWAPKIPPDPLLGAEHLERILSMRRTWPPMLVHADNARQLENYRTASLAFAEALEHYLHGEIAARRRMVAGQPAWTADVLAHHLAAYLREPDFLPARPRLYAAAEADPKLAEWLLPQMIERTPSEARAHRAWLTHLQRIGDGARFELALRAAEAAASGGR
jgi:spermidine synthase